jgi:hypothetical protein
MAALVDQVETDYIHIHLVNTDVLETREVILQAGGCAEHEFTHARNDEDDSSPVAIDSRHMRVRIDPGSQAQFKIGLKRFAHRPTYAQPKFD